MKRMVLFFLVMVFMSPLWGQAGDENSNLIQMAILLDTSNSMDGLIDQTKSQLWSIVNELALSRKNGKPPVLEVALFEFGKSSISVEENYLQMISGFTTDLDLISEKLFNLTTNGGEEYCGAVIQKSVDALRWNSRNDVLKVIFIAGNEPFSQGPVNYESACVNAIGKGIIVNTIYCGDAYTIEFALWKKGALLADGRYMNINQNQMAVYIEAPQDREIVKLNEELNRTYIYYGAEGEDFKERQEMQDSNAVSMGAESIIQRSVAKSSKQYNNSSWDLVDALNEEEIALDEIKEEQLPPEMKDMSDEERKAYIEELNQKREQIKRRIQVLNEERRKFIEQEKRKSAEQSTLDSAVIEIIKEQAERKQYIFK